MREGLNRDSKRAMVLLGIGAGSFIFYERVLYSHGPMSLEPEVRLFKTTWREPCFPSTHDLGWPKPRFGKIR